MDALAILQEAERADLELHIEGDKLVISGPRKAEPIVRRLAERKAEIMAALVPTKTSLSADKAGEPASIMAPADTATIPEHPWVIPEQMRRFAWPAGGWQELHMTLLRLWSAPRHDAVGTVSRYAPDVAARLAFSDLCDCWRRRHLPDEKDGTRARIEAAKALAAFGIEPPVG